MYIDAIERSLSDITALFSDENGFCESYQKLTQVIACRVIGDDVTYNKFFNKQINSRDECVLLIQDHLNKFKLLKKYILNLADAFQLSGFSRIADIIKFVTATLTVMHEQGSFWSICALTGKTSNKVSIWKSLDDQVVVDVKYEPFLVSIWTLYNVEDIEITKTSNHIHENKTLLAHNTMRQSIEDYLAKTDTIQHQNLYWKALTNIIVTLDLTVKAMQAQSGAQLPAQPTSQLQ